MDDRSDDGLQPEQVLAYLRARPGFLRDNPGLYEALMPPERVHGPAMADHMAAMLRAAQAQLGTARRLAMDVAADRRTAEGFARRVNEAVLALMRAPDAAWLAVHELAGLLRVDAARLCFEGRAPEGAATVPRGTVAAALGTQRAVLRLACMEGSGDAMLHGEAVALAQQEALLRVPVASGPALLALACRDVDGLVGASTDALSFLGQAVGAALDASR